MVEFGHRVGDLDLHDWNVAVARNLGAQYDAPKNEWYLDLSKIIKLKDPSAPNAPAQRALVVFKRPEPTTIDFVLPEITILCDSIVPARNRRASEGNVQYRVPAPGAKRISAGGKLGWSAYEVKPKAEPFDISYTIECWTRSRLLSQVLLQMVMASFPQMGRMTVVDSIGNEGVYAVYQQSTADLTQLGSMVDRVPAFSVTIKCEAELTEQQRSFTVAAFTGSTSDHPIDGITNTQIVNPDGSISGGVVNADGTISYDPNPGPGGLYGTGKPIIRAGLVEDV